MLRASPRITRLFSAEPGNASRVLRHRVPMAEAAEKEGLGLWERVYDTRTGDLVAFRLKVRVEDDSAIPSQSTPSAIVASEMEMNAFAHVFKDARSHTLRLREEDRLSREKRGAAPEDKAERTMAKVFVWPRIGAAERDILRVWPK